MSEHKVTQPDPEQADRLKRFQVAWNEMRDATEALYDGDLPGETLAECATYAQRVLEAFAVRAAMGGHPYVAPEGVAEVFGEEGEGS
jgi:uncharacterized protein YecT (DUF1311 family)